MNIRKARWEDLDRTEQLYNEIHDAEAARQLTTGWLRGIYPTRETAASALQRDDLFLLEDAQELLGAAVINQLQVDVYANAPWAHEAADREVCVLHTLVISPRAAKKGYGTQFVRFYENYAREHGCPELRMDTNARNLAARQLYAKLGYREIAIVPTVFNGIPGVDLVLLEKHLA
ncbi:MAG: GNAT family N-acetyltransferase [Oscillospiraceae bacterium]|nr:GNAT family N-acetyltransferase [Oscillospiraceae bacterium]